MKAMEMDLDMLYIAAGRMVDEGGSFAKHIARAFFVADSTNRKRLLTEFDDMFVRYYKEHRRDEIINAATQGESK